MDKFFDKWPEIKGAEFTLELDIYEEKGKIVVETPIVGIDPKNVEISIDDSILTIKGRTEKKSEVEEKNYYRKEVRAGSFYRSIVLPSNVVENKMEKTYKDGVLIIKIPKAPKTKTKK